jgi:hypothetical protein
MFLAYLTWHGENKQIWILLCSYSKKPTCLAMIKVSLLIAGTIFNPLKLWVDLGQSLTHASFTHLSVTLSHALATLLMEIKCKWKPQYRDRTKCHNSQITTWPPTLTVEDSARCQQTQTKKNKYNFITTLLLHNS